MRPGPATRGRPTHSREGGRGAEAGQLGVGTQAGQQCCSEWQLSGLRLTSTQLAWAPTQRPAGPGWGGDSGRGSSKGPPWLLPRGSRAL